MNNIKEKKKKGREKKISLRKLSLEQKTTLYFEHLRLIEQVAYPFRYNSRHLDFDDLVQEGVFGLFRAAELFNPEVGVQFSTYAIWWIRQFIMKTLGDVGRTIRPPGNVFVYLMSYNKARKSLLHELGREPSIEEIAERAKLKIQHVKEAEALAKKKEPLSLSTPKEEGSPIEGFIGDDRSIPSEVLAINKVFEDDLQKIREGLTTDENRLIRLRFGLEGNETHTFGEISKVFNVSRTAIQNRLRRICEKLQKLGLSENDL